MKVIGITGGTGTGKTTALRAIHDLGGLILDCDEIYHNLTIGSDAMKAELDARFPGVIANGTLDRKALGRIVFADENALADLNAITHRYVKEEVEWLLAQHKASGGSLAAIDAISLFESGLDKLCDFTVAINAPTEARARRIMARENIDYDYAMLRINAQHDNAYFSEKCTYTLTNDFETKEEFDKLCREFFTRKAGKYNE